LLINRVEVYFDKFLKQDFNDFYKQNFNDFIDIAELQDIIKSLEHLRINPEM
jgi:hypothetical protein